MYAFLLVQLGGLTEAFSQVVVGAGAIVLLLILVALGSFAYKSLNGGIEWPDEQSADEQEGVSQTSDDDEWKYS
jgi:hypothetical protein